MNRLIFIDTETTGLPPSKYTSYGDDVWKSCRLVQIAWEIRDSETKELINSECFIIKPTDYIIPPESSAIHGISHDDAMTNGIKLFEIWRKLELYMSSISTIVAHNIYFDNKVILSELFRYKSPVIFTSPCTFCVGSIIVLSCNSKENNVILLSLNSEQ